MEIPFDAKYAEMQIIPLIEKETEKIKQLEQKYIIEMKKFKIAQLNVETYYNENKVEIDKITAEIALLKKPIEKNEKPIHLVSNEISQLQNNPIYLKYISLKRLIKDDPTIHNTKIRGIIEINIKKQEELLQLVRTNPQKIIDIDITTIRIELYNYIQHLLKYMTSYDLFIIFNSLHDDILKIKSIKYNIIGNFKSKEDRLIVYVYSIQLNDETEININKGFFKSSGTSRSLGCTHCWIPTSYYNIIENRISKDEDVYLTDIEMIKIKSYEPKTILTQKNEIIIKNFEEFKTTANNLLNYGRFINKNIALASIILYWLDKDPLSGFSTKVATARDLTSDYFKELSIRTHEQTINFVSLLEPSNIFIHEFKPINIIKYYDKNISIPSPLKENSILSNSSNVINSTLQFYSFNYKLLNLKTIYHYMTILEILVNMYIRLSSTTTLAGGYSDKYYKKYIKYKTKYLKLKN